jgi:hypothetical protein
VVENTDTHESASNSLFWLGKHQRRIIGYYGDSFPRVKVLATILNADHYDDLDAIARSVSGEWSRYSDINRPAGQDLKILGQVLQGETPLLPDDADNLRGI